MRSGAATVIAAYGISLTPVSSFKYLGRILSVSGDDGASVVRNLRRDRLARVLGSEV